MRRTLLDDLAAREPGPAASSAAAATVAMAAAVVARAARGSPDWDEAAGVAAQALRLRERADELVDEAGRAYAAAAEALGTERPGDGTLMVRLERAAEAPLAIGRAAADVAALAALAAVEADDRVRPDAVAAAALAAGAAEAAAGIVAVNLGVTAHDERRADAEAHRRAAEASAAQARGV